MEPSNAIKGPESFLFIFPPYISKMALELFLIVIAPLDLKPEQDTTPPYIIIFPDKLINDCSFEFAVVKLSPPVPSLSRVNSPSAEIFTELLLLK